MSSDRNRNLTIEIGGDARRGVDAVNDAESATGRWAGTITRVGQVAAVGFAAVATGAAAVGMGLFNLGGSFDDAYDTISVRTGAVGVELEGLQDVFRGVVADVPTDFGSASEAIAGLASTLNISGQALEENAEAVLNLSRITDTDLNTNVENSAHLIEQWGIPAERMPSILNQIFRASQETGVGVADLEQQLVDNGAALRGVGLDFQESTALLATLGRAGLSAGDVMPGLSRAMATAAAEGRAAGDVFSETFAAIQNAPDDIAASGAALEVFGARAGPRLAQMIREGQLSYADLVGTIADGDATIAGTAAETEDFGEKWERIKNRVLLALEPVATRVFDAVGNAMDGLGPVIERVTAWFTQHLPPAVEKAQQVFDGIVGWVREHWPEIQETIGSVMTQVGGVITDVVDLVQAVWSAWGDDILGLVERVFPAIQQTIGGALEVIRGVIETVTSLIKGDWSGVWEGIQHIVHGAWEFVVGRIRMGIELARAVIGMALDTISGLFGGAWNGIRSVVSGGIDAVVGFVTGLPGRIGSAVAGAFAAIPGAFKTAINALIRLWNDFSIHYDGLTIHTPLGSQTIIPGFAFDTPNIPYLAQGGITRGPTTAMLGDNKSGIEAVVPLERAAEFGFGGGGGGRELHVHLHNHGAIGSEAQLGQWLRGALQQLKSSGALAPLGIRP